MRALLPSLARLWMIGLAVCMAAAASAETAWRANPDDALLFDVRLGQYRLGEGVRGYQTPDGVCLDLADVIVALDVPVRLDKKLRRATGWIFEEARTIEIDREASTVQIKNKKATLASGDIFDTPEGWCVKGSRLSEWFGIMFETDQTNALLFIKSSFKLPVEQALERRNRAAKIRSVSDFDLKSLPQASAPYGGVRAPSLDAVVRFGGLHQPGVGGGTRLNAGYELYVAGEAGPVAYNARLSSNRSGVPESLRFQAYRTDPTGRLLGPLKATQVALGDVSGVSTGLVSQSGAGRGAFLTNRPVERRDAFDRTDFRGELPSGWDAELYRNGQLLAFAANRADGRYEFLDVALLYGQNDFEVVLYGPQGQVRRERRIVPVGVDSIPPRKSYYWAVLTDEGRDLLQLSRAPAFTRGGLRGSVGIERGIDVKTSAALVAHSLRLEDGRRHNFGEISVRRALGRSLFEISGAGSDSGGAALRGNLLGRFLGASVNAETINAFGGYRSDRIVEGVRSIQSVAVDDIIGKGSGGMPLHLEARYTGRRDGNNSFDAAARLSSRVGRILVTGQIDWRDEKTRFGPDPEGVAEAAILANARIKGLRLRGEARYRLSAGSRFETATLVGEWAAGGDGRYRNDWRAEIGYDRPLRRARAGLGYVRRFDKLALTASLEAATDGAVAAGLDLAFSLGPDPGRGGVRMTSDRLATQGQAIARVFRDSNGDGMWQPGEAEERDVQLSAGRAPVDRLTDAKGRVIIDGLEPFQPILIGIDASSLPDPYVQPGTPGVVVTPRPGVGIAIDLPLTSAGEVDGTLLREGGSAIEGVDLELVDVEGRQVRKTRSEFDGYFLFEAVPYGRYQLRIAQATAQALGLSPSLGAPALVGGETPLFHMGRIVARTVLAATAAPQTGASR
jgi:hypothetical protein